MDRVIGFKSLTIICILLSNVSYADHAILMSEAMIPEIKKPMRIFKLGEQVVPTAARMQSLIRTAPLRKQIELKSLVGQKKQLVAFDKDRLLAFMQPSSGFSAIIPNIGSIKPSLQTLEQSKIAAASLLKDKMLFPKDDTSIEALPPISVVGRKILRNGESGKTENYMSIVRFQRKVNGIPVIGPGTSAMFGVDGDGAIQAFAYKWQTVKSTSNTVKPLTRSKISELIRLQLSPISVWAPIKVDSVSIAYYDGGKKFLQPVYRFDATILATPVKLGESQIVNNHVHGYVSIGEESEPLPKINTSLPVSAEVALYPNEQVLYDINSAHIDRIDVGRYVVQHNWDAIRLDSVKFWDGLMASQGMEDGKDRWGSDYGHFEFDAEKKPIEEENKKECQNTCAKEDKCKSWTYVKPGIQGKNAICWLKNAVANLSTNSCCTSGVSVFKDKQYFWAENRFYTKDKEKFVNSVQIAVTNGHGFDRGFTTINSADGYPLVADLKDEDSYVTIQQISKAGGFGGGTGGTLAYWIIRACSAVQDPNNNGEYWWNVFNGLHAVLGDRTAGFADDSVAYNFAKLIASRSPVVGAWFTAIASDPAYANNPTYEENGRKFSFGRGAVIVACGHEDDTIDNVAKLPAANCLNEIWMTDVSS